MINFFRIILCLFAFFLFFAVTGLHAQNSPLSKVLTLTGQKQGPRDIPQDNGIAGVWQKLQRLKTTASSLHTQAHPDDEPADLITYLSRGTGARTALLALNRGESGGNVLGVEFFDQLGLLRTEEFLLAASYYGLDDLYFTRLADYGFSKKVEEAYKKWDRQKVLGEMVRVIRTNRPLVIISRFHGSERDGHGNHQAAGEISQEAFRVAGDPSAFPEQITKEGLRPWHALKMYRGGVRVTEPYTIELNTSMYSPWLGDTYKNFSLLGYSFHRSQFGGNRRVVTGPFKQYYELLQSRTNGKEKETSFFDGIDTSISGIYNLTGETAPAGALPLLVQITEEVTNAVNAFNPSNTATILPFLTSGLAKTRAAIALASGTPEASFLLQVKERQFEDAINKVAGIFLQAVAVPAATKDKRGMFEPEPVMGFAVPGRKFKVEAILLNNSSTAIEPQSIKLIAPDAWTIQNLEAIAGPLKMNEKAEMNFTVTVPEDASFSQPYFTRNSIQDNQYTLRDTRYENLPWSAPVLKISASFLINNQLVQLQVPVQARQSNQPYGYDSYTLKVAPAIAVNLLPAMGAIPKSGTPKTINTQVELVNNFDSSIQGVLKLKTPATWKVVPSSIPFSFNKAGEKSSFSFQVTIPKVEEQLYNLQAFATANGKTYDQGYEVISHRDIDQVVLYHPAVTAYKGIDVKVTPGLKIGYVMGVGDEVPAGLTQLGAKVQLLNTSDLAGGKLSQYDAILVGTRAYAVRQDLNTYNQQLLNYSKNGGNLIVLFQTPEFVPDRMAAYPAILPGNSEEVSEEDSPVMILNPNHKVLNVPNKITQADFNNWVEQRGSKFFSKWDTAYVPIISTHDMGQQPQQGGWLMAKYGKGYYTYCAYSFHRQMPYAVEGAFRIMANLISYGKK